MTLDAWSFSGYTSPLCFVWRGDVGYRMPTRRNIVHWATKQIRSDFMAETRSIVFDDLELRICRFSRLLIPWIEQHFV